MSASPQVSVVIPTFNRGRYITDAVASVLDQTCRDVELVVVDDGSTDDTAELLAPFAGQLRYVRTENQGPARARNEGMRLARGKYIAWLDSDDLYRPFKLELQVRVLDMYPEVALVTSEASAFDDRGDFGEFHLSEYHSSAYRRGSLTYEDIYSRKVALSELLSASQTPPGFKNDWMDRYLYIGRIFEAYLMNTLVFANSVMFRRVVLDQVGPQQPRFGLFHDLEFVLRITRDFPVAFLDVPTFRLRYHPGQISTTTGPDRTSIAIRKQRDLLRVFKAHAGANTDYYRAHREEADRQLARLHRAVAIPLMSLEPGHPHRDRYYPRRARRHLARCAALGYPQPLLWALSFAPRMARRAGLAAIRLRQKFVHTLKARVMPDGQG